MVMYIPSTRVNAKRQMMQNCTRQRRPSAGDERRFWTRVRYICSTFRVTIVPAVNQISKLLPPVLWCSLSNPTGRVDKGIFPIEFVVFVLSPVSSFSLGANLAGLCILFSCRILWIRMRNLQRPTSVEPVSRRTTPPFIPPRFAGRFRYEHPRGDGPAGRI